MTSTFKVGDLVWAKIRYCPAWPAKVVDHPTGATKKNCYYVFFYGSENYAWVKHTDISSYVNGFEVKRDFRSEVYIKAVKQIANIFHEQQLENGYAFFKNRKPKRTSAEKEERHRKIQERLKVRLFPKKGTKKKVNKNKIIQKREKSSVSASSSCIASSSSIPSTIKVQDLKKYFIRELSVGIKRIDVDPNIPILVKDYEPECICVEDQPPTLQLEL